MLLHKCFRRRNLTTFWEPTGERCQGVSAGSNPEPERRQPAPPGGILQRLHQAQEVHRVGVQHHRHELRAAHRLLDFRCLTTMGAGLQLSQSSVLRANRKICSYEKKNKKKTQLELSTLVSGFYKPVPNTASPTSLWICGLATTNNDFMAERSQCGNPSQPLPGGMHSLPSNAPVCVHVMGCWFSCMANDKDVKTHPKEMGFKLSG